MQQSQWNPLNEISQQENVAPFQFSQNMPANHEKLFEKVKIVSFYPTTCLKAGMPFSSILGKRKKN